MTLQVVVNEKLNCSASDLRKRSEMESLVGGDPFDERYLLLSPVREILLNVA
jgi:hypothetical protein